MFSVGSTLRRVAGLSALLSALALTAAAQITISIPKIPKIKKTTQSEPAKPADTSTTASQPDTSSVQADSKPASSDCTNSGFVMSHMDSIKKVRQEVDEYRPGLRDYYVSTLSDNKNLYLEAALLPTQRKNWYTDSNIPADMQQCFNPALDALAEAAKKTLPSYTGPTNYTFGTPVEKKVLLTQINDIAKATVLKSGLEEANWLIEKNDYGLPTARYKHGYILAKYPGNENTNCWLFWVNIVQDYAGGGTYAASHGNYVGRMISGCPAGK